MACDAPTPSGIYVIEINTVSRGNLWVLDIDCGSHICNDMQGLRDSRKLTRKSPTFKLVMVKELRLLLLGLMF